MAPMPKRAHDDEEAADPKRSRTEEEAADDASGSDEEVSADGDLQDLEVSDYDEGSEDPEDDGDDEEFTKEDFEGVDLNDDELANFKEANLAWHKQLLAKEEQDGMVSMVIGSVVDMRPVAQSVEDLEKGMTVLLIPRVAHEKSDDYKKELSDIITEIEDDDEEKELSDEEELELLRKICVKQGDRLIKFIDDVKARVEKKEFDGLWANTVVLTNVVFDDEVHQLFSDMVPETGKKVLAALKSLWDLVLKLSDEDMKISAGDRKATMTMLKLCKEDLQSGTLRGTLPDGDEDRENPFAEPDFDFA